MSQLNMKDLYSTINEKTLKRMEIYDDVLKKCHHRIKYNSSLERTYCFFQIPEFIIGVPLYDITGLLRLPILLKISRISKYPFNDKLGAYNTKNYGNFVEKPTE